MPRIIAVLSVALILCTCSSFASIFGSTVTRPAPSANLNHWVSLPKPGALVIIGVSSRLSKREYEIAAAREDAARKAALYHGVRATFEIEQNETGHFLSGIVYSSLTMEYDLDLEKYMDKLVFDPKRDITTRDNEVLIRFTYPAAFPGNINYTFAQNADGSPGWTTSRQPKINGVLAGVGFAPRHQRLQDTITKSYEDALVNLVTNLSATVEASQTSSESSKTLFGIQNSTSFKQHSIGNLKNFLILEIWIDPDTQGVRTLVVAQDLTN
jgi:hypothetical protein